VIVPQPGRHAAAERQVSELGVRLAEGVADWIYDALESFQTFMDKGTLVDCVWMFGMSAIGTVLLVAVHEAGTRWPYSLPATVYANCGSATRTT
jgi:hypothetical protein